MEALNNKDNKRRITQRERPSSLVVKSRSAAGRSSFFASIKSRSAAGRSSFSALIKSRPAAGVFFALLAFFASSLHSFSAPGHGLIHNQPVSFADITQSAKIAFKHENGASAEKLMVETFGSGVAWLDYDNDGFLDLYVTGYGANTLYRNNGNGTFTDVTAKAGVKGGSWSSSAGFFDYDRDGDLDLYVVRYLDYDVRENVYCGYQK